MFLEDVSGYESGEVAAALIASAWVEYSGPATSGASTERPEA
jgi:hypothetical protein